MSDTTDRDYALDELERLSQASSEPTLSAEEIDAVLDKNQRASRWVANTALLLGAVVMPNARIGRVYKVTTEGTTGATEPVWADSEGATVTDGTVEFTESGKDFANVYDITGAVRDAWALKAAKAAEMHEGDESKVFDHCQETTERYNVPLIA